jgi:hypothetical protein
MKPEPLYQIIARTLEARANCIAQGASHAEWKLRHESYLRDIERNLLPSGSGIDDGCKLLLEDEYDGSIRLEFGFHAMDENGYYCGWTHYTCAVRPSLTSGFDLALESGVDDFDTFDLEDYLYQTFDYMLRRPVEWDDTRKAYRFAPEPAANPAAGIIAGADTNYYRYTVTLCSPIDSAEGLEAALAETLKPEKGCGLLVVGPLSDEDLMPAESVSVDMPPVNTADAAEAFAGEG